MVGVTLQGPNRADMDRITDFDTVQINSDLFRDIPGRTVQLNFMADHVQHIADFQTSDFS